jgi:hypothetical protein
MPRSAAGLGLEERNPPAVGIGASLACGALVYQREQAEHRQCHAAGAVGSTRLGCSPARFRSRYTDRTAPWASRPNGRSRRVITRLSVPGEHGDGTSGVRGSEQAPRRTPLFLEMSVARCLRAPRASVQVAAKRRATYRRACLHHAATTAGRNAGVRTVVSARRLISGAEGDRWCSARARRLHDVRV